MKKALLILLLLTADCWAQTPTSPNPFHLIDGTPLTTQQETLTTKDGPIAATEMTLEFHQMGCLPERVCPAYSIHLLVQDAATISNPNGGLTCPGWFTQVKTLESQSMPEGLRPYLEIQFHETQPPIVTDDGLTVWPPADLLCYGAFDLTPVFQTLPKL